VPHIEAVLIYAVNCKLNCSQLQMEGVMKVLFFGFFSGCVAMWLFVHWITENGWYEIVESKKEGRAE